jgi:hypothetical protein
MINRDQHGAKACYIALAMLDNQAYLSSSLSAYWYARSAINSYIFPSSLFPLHRPYTISIRLASSRVYRKCSEGKEMYKMSMREVPCSGEATVAVEL